MSTETRTVAVELTPRELEDYSNELASILVQKSNLEMERKKLNAQIKPLVERTNYLAAVIDSRKEMKEVECRWSYFWEEGEKVLHYHGEEVERQRITAEERQQELA